jgi:hypothetical protein
MSESKKSSNVPGQFVGYSLQTTECLRQLLLGSRGTAVSVEVIDDVGVTEPDGTSRRKFGIRVKGGHSGIAWTARVRSVIAPTIPRLARPAILL